MHFTSWALVELIEAAPRAARYPSARPAPCSGSPTSPAPARATGRLAPRPARGRWSVTAQPPRTSTATQSTASAALACGWNWGAPACSTASGCAASGAGVTPAISSPARSRSSTRSAPAFAERARIELRATGGHARQRTTETPDTLTAQGALIARLAGDGASNPQIAAQLFISPATVAGHLRKVLAKFSVSSRAQLSPARPARQGSAPPVALQG
jgi:DNA-binding CsgD family transcriptional regulator